MSANEMILILKFIEEGLGYRPDFKLYPGSLSYYMSINNYTISIIVNSIEVAISVKSLKISKVSIVRTYLDFMDRLMPFIR